MTGKAAGKGNNGSIVGVVGCGVTGGQVVTNLTGVGRRVAAYDPSHPLVRHFYWVFGASSMPEVIQKAAKFKLEGILQDIKCPYLVIHGGHDVLGVAASKQVYEAAKAAGVDVTLRLTSADETGADHCQHDNPTLGQELMIDWLADRFDIDQRRLLGTY